MDIELSLIFLVCFLEIAASCNFVNTSCGIKGRLSAAVDFWKSTLNASECVVDIITVGFLSRDIRPHVFG